VFNTTAQTLEASLAGFGLAYMPEDLTPHYVAEGLLKQVLKTRSSTYPGHHLYYSNRRQSSLAFVLVDKAPRYQS
jgi:DNA-binding transcriptional LysR family regulator